MAARSKAWICCRFLAGIAASNRIPPGVWMSISVSVVCFQVEVSASGRLLVQRRRPSVVYLSVIVKPRH